MANIFDQAQPKPQFSVQPVPEIPKVDIIPDNREAYQKCISVLKHFFLKGVGPRAPLKGFLLEGPPGTGKTECARQVAREIGAWLIPGKDEAFLVFLDGASIASPRWGDAETTLRNVFRSALSYCEPLKKERKSNPRVILLFDDIESLMLARSSEVAKEWHFSINAVLFHELDRVDPSRTFVLATTNRPDLVDEALRDRLYSIVFRHPSIESLLEVAKEQLKILGEMQTHHEKDILKAIENKLKALKSPTIRDAERLVILEFVERQVGEI